MSSVRSHRPSVLRRIGEVGTNFLRKLSGRPLAATALCLGTLGMASTATAGISIGTPQQLDQTAIYIAPRLKQAPGDPQGRARCSFVGVPITGDGDGQKDVYLEVVPSSSNLSLGLNPDRVIHIGEVHPGEQKIGFFYMCAADGVTADVLANAFTVNAYSGDPLKTPAPSEIGTRGQTIDVIYGDNHAQSSKAFTIDLNPSTGTWVGGIYQMTLTGQAGTIGAGERVVFTPSIYPSFPADKFELRSVALEITGGGVLPLNCQNGAGGSMTRTLDRLAWHAW